MKFVFTGMSPLSRSRIPSIDAANDDLTKDSNKPVKDKEVMIMKLS